MVAQKFCFMSFAFINVSKMEVYTGGVWGRGDDCLICSIQGREK